MLIDTKLTISRSSSGGINIEVRDVRSRVKFLNIQISLENFAECLTGLSEVDCEGRVEGLEYVGKRKVTEQRQKVCPIKYDRKAQEVWLIENAQEEGWILGGSLGSRNSVTYDEDENAILNYFVYKYE